MKGIVFLAFLAWSHSSQAMDCFIYRKFNNIHYARVDLSCRPQIVVGGGVGKRISIEQFATDNKLILAVNGNFYIKGYGVIGPIVFSNGSYSEIGLRASESHVFSCINMQCSLGAFDLNKFNYLEADFVISGWQYYDSGLGSFICLVSAHKRCIDNMHEEHPRTILGFDKKGDILYLLVFEGRKHGFRGFSLSAVANFLKSFDIPYAINLDGGGSSAMWYENSVVSKMPVGFTHTRKVVNYIGIKSEF